jgi:hypothetical protein
MFLMQRKHDTYLYLCFADLNRLHNQRTSVNQGHNREVLPVRLFYADYFFVHSSNIYVSSYRATCLFDECQIIGKGLVCTPQLCCLDIRSTSIELNNVSSDITKQTKK